MANTMMPTGPLCTRESLAQDLQAIGIERGDTVLVHSSLRSLGWVCGGTEAVVQALQDAVGAAGTLVAPAMSGQNSDPAEWRNPPVPAAWFDAIRAAIPAYDPHTTYTRSVGAVAETLRTWPGARRSAHPQTSFAALGARAAEVTSGHALDSMLGERSPLARLEEIMGPPPAKVLLLGVGFDKCTAFHLAEYRLPTAKECPNAFAADIGNGREWVTDVTDIALSDARFGELGRDMEREDWVSHGRVGGASVRLFPLSKAVAYAKVWLVHNRLGA